jgi:branched-chain amino acid transport system substrate-binding protein
VIGVIGAFNSGCSAVELPILNRAANGPLAMISPTNTVVGLTRAGPGTAPGEPGRYYPTGIRNYARIAATDNVQAAADAIQVRQLGARKISVLYEPYGYGRGLAAAFASAAAKLGLTVVARQSFQYDLPRYTPLVTQVERAHPDAVLIAGVASTSTVEMIKELRVALGPGVKIMATDGFSDLDLLLKLAGAAAEGMTVSAPGVPNEQLPAKGRQFVAAFGKAVGEGPGPYPAYAAQAAEVLLDAIARSNGTRASVTKQLFMTSVKNGILGTFSIDRNGDTTAGAITIYRIVRGKPTVLSVITPPRRLVER